MQLNQNVMLHKNMNYFQNESYFSIYKKILWKLYIIWILQVAKLINQLNEMKTSLLYVSIHHKVALDQFGKQVLVSLHVLVTQ